MPRFGEQRLVRADVSAAHRLHFRMFGVADPAHFVHHRWMRRELAEERVRDPRRILDAGCGTGDHSFYLARRFPEAHVLGVDIDRQRIERNRDTAGRLGMRNIQFEVADLERFDEREAFDLVVSIDVLEHIAGQAQAMANLAAALRPGGLALFHIPCERPRPAPFSRFLQDFHEWGEREHVADELSAEVFAQRVADSGLTVVRTRRTFGYFTGELATSLFAIPYRNTTLNRALQLAVSVPCRGLALLDSLELDATRYAVGVTARRPG